MRKWLPIVCMLAGFTQAAAQSHQNMGLKERMMGVVAQPVTTGGAGNKTTATYWRLKAYSTYQLNGLQLEMADSSHYMYSNARGNNVQLDALEDNLDDWGVESGILMDSAYKYSDNGSGVELNEKYFGQYNSANEKILFSTQSKMSGTFENDTREAGVRDANGKLTKLYSMYWNSSTKTWDTTVITDYTYDAQKNLLLDSSYNPMGTPTPVSKTTYTYDGNNNLLQTTAYYYNGTAWDSSYRETYTYYTSNKVKTSQYEYYDSTQWVNAYADSSGYNTGGALVYQLSKMWDTASAQWVNSSLEERTVNSNNQPAMIKVSMWDTTNKVWEPSFDADLAYYSINDLPQSVTVYPYLGGFKSPFPVLKLNMYYEHYFNVGIEDTKAGNEVTVYPNPATEYVNVRFNNSKTGQVSLIDLNGRTVRTGAADNQNTVTVPVKGLPAGNYILNVTSGSASPVKQMIVIQ